MGIKIRYRPRMCGELHDWWGTTRLESDIQIGTQHWRTHARKCPNVFSTLKTSVSIQVHPKLDDHTNISTREGSEVPQNAKVVLLFFKKDLKNNNLCRPCVYPNAVDIRWSTAVDQPHRKCAIHIRWFTALPAVMNSTGPAQWRLHKSEASWHTEFCALYTR